MAKLRAKKRRNLKKGQFGLPGPRRYPIPDKSHASNAKARSTQQYRKGKLSKSSKDKIHAKANRILKRGRG